ncbi:hypothetical protein [Staphylococcus durrellii]|uniref:hypothetical protein n=1 Tax=Staphylococcus durrellii TaxID=2781773 RepID=UPI00189D8700|nr:hypothetical protein [Staphylococcus durrellii]MBF7016368.1 hypothetical protein [Staphylococcus durrellii]
MSNSLTVIIRTQLYDYHDTTKAALSELNQSKSLVINGPDDQLIDRGLNISFYRGQKKTINAVNSLLDAYEDDEVFRNHYEQYAQNITEDYNKAAQNFAQMNLPDDDFATVISYLFTLKGQKIIIDSINTLVTSN